MNVNSFLLCETPRAWIDKALVNLDVLLIDHANCEKKAASTALNLIYRHVEYPHMILQLSKLAREELRHFEQVVSILKKRNINYSQISPARYARELRKGIRTHEPARLTDLLIVSAIVEARSCERFEKLVPVLDEELSEFYTSLLKSESRHFRSYLKLAEAIAEAAELKERIDLFLAKDAQLITLPASAFRFRSGTPRSWGKSRGGLTSVSHSWMA